MASAAASRKPGEHLGRRAADLAQPGTTGHPPLRRQAAFLAGDAAEYITGQSINVDGGMFMS